MPMRTRSTALEILPAAPNPLGCPRLAPSALLALHRVNDSTVVSVTVASKIYCSCLREGPISRHGTRYGEQHMKKQPKIQAYKPIMALVVVIACAASQLTAYSHAEHAISKQTSSLPADATVYFGL